MPHPIWVVLFLALVLETGLRKPCVEDEDEKENEDDSSLLRLSLNLSPQLLLAGLISSNPDVTYFASNANSTFVGAPSLTSISCVVVPAFRCAAFKVYFPAGTFEILKVPSLPETAK